MELKRKKYRCERGNQGSFGIVARGQRVKGQDCWPPHWLSTGRRRSSSTCLATSMVSSRSNSWSPSSMGSLLREGHSMRHDSGGYSAHLQSCTCCLPFDMHCFNSCFSMTARIVQNLNVAITNTVAETEKLGKKLSNKVLTFSNTL